MSSQRLQKVLAQAGVASRRAAETLITEGRVRVNGRIVRELGARANLHKDRVEVDGRRLVAQRHVYFLMHKPRGVVTTLDDPEGRKTVKDLLRNVHERVFPVGRLDFQTSGALLLTNDGELAQALLHPTRAVPKTYNAKLQGKLDEERLEQLRTGVVLDDGHKTAPAEVKVLRSDDKSTSVEITIAEGKNRQIHRMGEAIGRTVLRLTRISFAGLTLEGLRPGQLRPLTARELTDLKEAYVLKARRRKPARGYNAPAGLEVDPGPDELSAHDSWGSEEAISWGDDEGAEAKAPAPGRTQPHDNRGARSPFGGRTERTSNPRNTRGAGSRDEYGAGNRTTRNADPRDAYGAAAHKTRGTDPREAYGRTARGAGPQETYGSRKTRGADPRDAYGAGRRTTRSADPRETYGARKTRGADPRDAYGAGSRTTRTTDPPDEYGAGKRKTPARDSAERGAHARKTRSADPRGAYGARSRTTRSADPREAYGARKTRGADPREAYGAGKRTTPARDAAERGAHARKARGADPQDEFGAGGRTTRSADPRDAGARGRKTRGTDPRDEYGAGGRTTRSADPREAYGAGKRTTATRDGAKRGARVSRTTTSSPRQRPTKTKQTQKARGKKAFKR